MIRFIKHRYQDVKKDGEDGGTSGGTNNKPPATDIMNVTSSKPKKATDQLGNGDGAGTTEKKEKKERFGKTKAAASAISKGVDKASSMSESLVEGKSIAPKFLQPILGATDLSTNFKKQMSEIAGSMGEFGQDYASSPLDFAKALEDVAESSKKTGLSFKDTQEQVSEFISVGKNIAAGMTNASSAMEVTTAATKQFTEASMLARNVGMSNQELLETSASLYENQGATIEDTAKSIAIANAAFGEAGMNTKKGMDLVKNLSSEYKFLTMDVDATSMALANFAAEQEVAALGDRGFKTGEQAAESMSKAMGAAGSAGLNEAMYYSGGNALEYFDADPQKRLEMMMSTLDKESSTGKALTREDVDNNKGLEGEYLGQMQRIAKALGMSMNEAMKFNEQRGKTGVVPTQEKIAKIKGEGAALQEKSIKESATYDKNLMDTQQKQNQAFIKTTTSVLNFSSKLNNLSSDLFKKIADSVDKGANAALAGDIGSLENVSISEVIKGIFGDKFNDLPEDVRQEINDKAKILEKPMQKAKEIKSQIPDNAVSNLNRENNLGANNNTNETLKQLTTSIQKLTEQQAAQQEVLVKIETDSDYIKAVTAETVTNQSKTSYNNIS